jgi:eukaryotic-like serine/threonine-protein kinase
MPTAPANAKDLSALIVRSRLLGPDDLKIALRHLPPAGSDADDLEAVRRALITGKHLTDYQAALLMRGHADGFFLGPYKILDRIAKGRMAGVYKAVHDSGQVVAIKVLPASRAKDPETLARFQREARLLTRLDHPNVVRAFQVGVDDGRHYLVLEYLDGDTLEEVLGKRKRLPPTEAMRIVHDALLGLQHIHERGMIHRDLEPANLMLVGPSDATDRAVKILDIGLGKAVFEEAKSADPNQITGDGVLIGTPEYLAPEQARSAKTADIRADIYSLGCVLYHALTGQSPFPDKSVVTQVMRHATEPPRPLSEFLSEVPDGLQNVLNWMLAKNPAQRYPTPEKAAQALNLLLKHTPPSRPAPPPLPAFTKWLAESGEVDAPKPAAPANIPVGRLEPSGKKPKPAPSPPAPVPDWALPQVAAPALVPAKPVPAAAPVPVAAKPAPMVAPLDIDVELVSVPLPSDDARGLFELNRRDAIMLCAGGAMVLTAILAGYGLSRALHKEPPPVEQNPPAHAPPEG